MPAANAAIEAAARALLITGTVGAGKTSVADALGDLVAEAGIPGAVIDLDWLRRSWPSAPGDPFNTAIARRNLRAVAATYLAAGAHRLILAGVIETPAERSAYQAALGIPLTVGRLRVEPPTLHRRLTRRHAEDPPGRLEWHLARSDELDQILDRARVDDFVVDATTGSIREVAHAVKSAAGW